MQYIYIGKLVNTHGIKGEVRILSDFKYKETIFKEGNSIYIGNNRIQKKINSYRKHKEFDMLCFEGIYDINDIITYKGENIYFNREEIELSGILDEDIIGMDVYDKGKLVGKVTSILKSVAHDILEIENNGHKSLVPNIDVFVKKIDLENNRIELDSIEGLLYED